MGGNSKSCRARAAARTPQSGPQGDAPLRSGFCSAPLRAAAAPGTPGSMGEAELPLGRAEVAAVDIGLVGDHPFDLVHALGGVACDYLVVRRPLLALDGHAL